MFPKNLLYRFVKNSNNIIEFDKTDKKDGRGAYICKNATCTEKLKKSRLLNRSYKMQVDNSVYEALEWSN